MRSDRAWGQDLRYDGTADMTNEVKLNPHAVASRREIRKLAEARSFLPECVLGARKFRVASSIDRCRTGPTLLGI